MILKRLTLPNAVALLSIGATFATAAFADSSQNASANPAANVNAFGTPEVQEVASKKSFGIATELSVSSSLHEMNDPNHIIESSFLAVPSYDVAPDWTISVRESVTGNLNQDVEQKADFDDGYVRLTHGGIPVGKVANLSFMGTVLTPLSKPSREDATLNTGVRLAAKIFSAPQALILKNLSLNYQISGGRNFHRYETAGTGISNNQWVISNLVEAQYNFTEAFYAFTDFSMGAGWTYRGELNTANTFTTSQSLNYDLNKQWSVAVEHSNEAPTIKANGAESNVSISDPETSRVSAKVSYTF